ncbi:MAG: alcohol dehydrogenase catalytic domain-containing protein [Ignavibacteriales bacterium]
MKAMVLREYGKPLCLEEVPTPEAGPEEVVVRVGACGLCATDLKIAAGEIPDTRTPLIMGHEPAGEIVAVGGSVNEFAVGDRVMVLSAIPCGECSCCVVGKTNLCTKFKVGFNQNGGHAEYLRVSSRVCVMAPKSMDFANSAVLVGAASAPYHALKTRAKVKRGETVLVMGVGGLGLHGVQVARALGARVIAVDVKQEHLDMALENGAEEAIRYPCKDYVRKVKELCGGEGPEIVLETVSLTDTLTENIAVLRRGGRLVMLGYHPNVPLTALTPRLVLDEIEILGARSVTRAEMNELASMADEGSVKPILTRVYPLEEANQAMMDLKMGRIPGRAVLVP